MLVADSVEYTSTRLTTREPTTCTVARLTAPCASRLTWVVPPSETVAGIGAPDPAVRVYSPGVSGPMRWLPSWSTVTVRDTPLAVLVTVTWAPAPAWPATAPVTVGGLTGSAADVPH